MQALIDHEAEAIGEKVLQHQIGGLRRRAVRNLSDDVEQVQTHPAGATGDRVFRHSPRGFKKLKHGCIAVNVTPFAQYSAEVLRGAVHRGAEVNVRHFELWLLLGEPGDNR